MTEPRDLGGAAPDSESADGGRPLPPPVIYMGWVGVGFALDYIWPIAFVSGTARFVVGAALITLSVILFGVLLRHFLSAGTSFDHGKPTRVLLTTGLYARSRNPIYITLTLLMLGIATVADNVWMLAASVPAVWMIDRFVIRREEDFLERKFGDTYRRYKAAVRRWV